MCGNVPCGNSIAGCWHYASFSRIPDLLLMADLERKKRFNLFYLAFVDALLVQLERSPDAPAYTWQPFSRQQRIVRGQASSELLYGADEPQNSLSDQIWTLQYKIVTLIKDTKATISNSLKPRSHVCGRFGSNKTFTTVLLHPSGGVLAHVFEEWL